MKFKLERLSVRPKILSNNEEISISGKIENQTGIIQSDITFSYLVGEYGLGEILEDKIQEIENILTDEMRKGFTRDETE